MDQDSIYLVGTRKIGLGAGDTVLDGNEASPKRGHTQPPPFGPCILWPNLLDGSRCHLV